MVFSGVVIYNKKTFQLSKLFLFVIAAALLHFRILKKQQQQQQHCGHTHLVQCICRIGEMHFGMF